MPVSKHFHLAHPTLTRSPNSEKYLSLVQLNCNGLSSKLSELKLYIFTKKPDIVCLCETWVRRTPPRFPGYQAVWLPRPEGLGEVSAFLSKMIFLLLLVI